MHVVRFDELLDAHPPAHVVVREDQRPRRAEVLVSAGVVAVPVRVEHKTYRPIAYRADRRNDRVGQRRVLVIDQEYAVGADRYGHVAAPAG